MNMKWLKVRAVRVERNILYISFNENDYEAGTEAFSYETRNLELRWLKEMGLDELPMDDVRTEGFAEEIDLLNYDINWLRGEVEKAGVGLSLYKKVLDELIVLKDSILERMEKERTTGIPKKLIVHKDAPSRNRYRRQAEGLWCEKQRGKVDGGEIDKMTITKFIELEELCKREQAERKRCYRDRNCGEREELRRRVVEKRRELGFPDPETSYKEIKWRWHRAGLLNPKTGLRNWFPSGSGITSVREKA